MAILAEKWSKKDILFTISAGMDLSQSEHWKS